MAPLPCFEDLMKLAKSDPKAFDAYRQSLCSQFINSIPSTHRPRLRAVQFRVDRVISRAKTPMAGLIQVSGMMHDSLHTLSCRLSEISDPPALPPATKRPPAPVIHLQQWRAQHRSRRGE